MTANEVRVDDIPNATLRNKSNLCLVRLNKKSLGQKNA